MKDWKISMPDGWKPGENGEICSEACPFFYSYTRTGKQFCYPHKCPLASAVEDEPKDCGFTLATCPYERCAGITMRKPVEVEPLAVIGELCKRAYATSKAHGWKHDNDGQAIALMHSELSEALEALRKPGKKDEHLPDLNPVGLELADVLIRVFDFCGARGIDLGTCLQEKMDYNENRPFKHGGKVF